jgi:hypothetical protein
MSPLKSAIGVTSVLAALVLPAFASAETVVVPPGNSAATQYTETFPSSRGNVDVSGGRAGGGSPTKALGRRTAHALESHGEDGAAVAALAAEPPTAKARHHRRHRRSAAGGNGSGGGVSGNSPAGGEASGSSGLGQVLSSATLSSSGEMGIFLPLVLIAALAGSLAYAWRRQARSSRT